MIIGRAEAADMTCLAESALGGGNAQTAPAPFGRRGIRAGNFWHWLYIDSLQKVFAFLPLTPSLSSLKHQGIRG
jgi:hypothetical protein